MRTGIYKIQCMKTSVVYIGSSENVERRWKTHKRELSGNYHCNDGLQDQWNWHGERSFIWEVIEEVEVERLKIREQFWINYYRSRSEFSVVNIQGASSDWQSVAFERHESFWQIKPPRLGGVPLGQECMKCEGSGRASSLLVTFDVRCVGGWDGEKGLNMLTMKRRQGEKLILTVAGERIVIEVRRTTGTTCSLGITASERVTIDREEVHERKAVGNGENSQVETR